MEPIVFILLAAIYISAVAAPLSLFILARRLGQGPLWQGVISICTGLIWLALILGLAREVMDIQVANHLLEAAGVMAVLAFATLAVVGLVMVTRTWPSASDAKDPISRLGDIRSWATDIE